MKVWILLLATILLPLNVAAQANLELFASTLKEERAKGEELGPLTSVLGGAGRAFLIVNADLANRKRPELFCAPQELRLNHGNYVVIALEQYERYKSVYGAHCKDSPLDCFVQALLNGLVRTFPCK